MNGSMIALYPPRDLAEQLAVPGGLPPESIHCTVAYTGPAADVDQDTLRAVAASLGNRPPINATVSGHARFTGGEQDVIVALVDGPGIEDLRRDTVDALAALGIDIPREHGYCSHLTLAYIDPGAESPIIRLPATPVTFTTVNAVHAGNRTGYTLVGETAPALQAAARHAYASGWASVPDAPMTAEVRAGCTAAITWAAENTHRPDVLEATVKLGQLEGTWALVYQRRARRDHQHEAAVLAAWRRFLELVDLDELVARFHATTATLPDTTPEAIHLQALSIARQAFLGLNLADPLYGQLLDSITTALADAQAEGTAAGHAIGDHTTDVAAAYDEARTQISDLTTWGQAAGWATRILSAAATDLARTLAKGFALALAASALRTAVGQALSDGAVPSVATVLDLAMSQAWNSGALNAYAAQGVTMVNFWTVGDNKVCQACDDAEAGSPYPIQDAPEPGLHPRCRCTLAPADAPVPGVPPPPTTVPDTEET